MQSWAGSHHGFGFSQRWNLAVGVLFAALDFFYVSSMKLLGDFLECVCAEQHTRRWELCS